MLGHKEHYGLHLRDVRFLSKGLGLKNFDLYFSHRKAGVKSGGGRTITAPLEQEGAFKGPPVPPLP